jgi:hypothetical protein
MMQPGLRPREIANQYINGQDINWVKEQCKAYQHPEAVFRWVGIYVKGARNASARDSKQLLRSC